MKAKPEYIQIAIRHLETIIVNLKTQKSKSPKIRLSALIEIQALQAVVDDLKSKLGKR